MKLPEQGRVTFASMKAEAERSAGALKLFWKDGASTFFQQGYQRSLARCAE